MAINLHVTHFLEQNQQEVNCTKLESKKTVSSTFYVQRVNFISLDDSINSDNSTCASFVSVQIICNFLSMFVYPTRESHT
jgi:hypothetical protein